MFRRSSKRALSSTRHTLCFPSSDASISAGTSGDSSLVRYTVALIAITSGSRGGLRTNASNVAANESYGWWTSRSPRAISAKISDAVAAVAKRGGVDRDPGLVLQLRAGRATRAGQLGRGRAARRPCRPGRCRRRAQPSAARPSPSTQTSETSSRTTSPKRRRRSSQLDRLEQVVGLVGDLEVRVARDAEDSALGDLHLREERREEVGDHPLERDEAGRACRLRRSAASPPAP